MAKYYHKCCVCNKTVKRKTPDFTGRIICNPCKRNENTINCQCCGKPFFKRKTVRKFCSGKCSGKYLGEHVLKGRTLSKEHKEKLSKVGNHTGNTKCKYYKVFNLYMNKTISVQGTYELGYANYLNENNVNWIRDNKISMQYKKDDNIIRNYFPDFYLPDIDEYIEIKGYFYPKDREKMKLVQEQNINKKINILFKEDLELLNIL